MFNHFPACRSSNAGFPPPAEFGVGTASGPWLGDGEATPFVGLRFTRVSTTGRRERRAAFTLIEMLVVMVIVIVLISLTVPATTSLLRGLQINQNGQLIESQLDLARQTALSNNRNVEVRLCQVNGKFSAILPLLITSTANSSNTNQPVYQAIGKASFIGDSVVIDSGPTLSTLVSPNGTTANAPVTNYSNPPLGSFGQNYKYVSFKFKPDGTTDLDQSSLWFLTLHSSTDPNPDSNAPNNFYTIQVDAYNGHVTQFRP